MDSKFEILGYHKELYDVQTGKYVGYVRMQVPDRSEAKFGWFGRTKMHVKGQAIRASKTFNVDDEYVTECVPVCGAIRIEEDRFKTIEEAHEWRNQAFANDNKKS